MNVPRSKDGWGWVRHTRQTGRGWPTCTVAVSVVVTALLLASGCTRSFYRNWTDREVASVLEEKNVFTEWYVQDVNVYPNRLARYYDPTNPDHPPMPPDDPAAWLLSTHSQKPKDVAWVEGTGYLELLATWDVENRANLKRKKDLAKMATVAHRLGLGLPTIARMQALNKGPELATKVGLGLGRPQAGSTVVQVAHQQPTAPEVVPNGPQPKYDTSTSPVKPPDPTADAQAPKSKRCPTPLCPELPYMINMEQSVELGVLNSREYQDRREDLYVAALPVTFERFEFLPQFLANQDAFRRWSGDESVVGPNNDWNFTTTGGFTQRFFTGALLAVNLVNRTAVNLTGNKKHTESVSELTLDLAQPLLQGGGRAVALEGLTQSERNFVYAIRDYARFQRAFVVAVMAGVNLDVEFSVGGRTFSAGLTSSSTPIGYLQTLLRQEQLTNDIRNEQLLAAIGDRFTNLAKGGSVSKLQVDQIEQERLRARSQVLSDEVQYGDALDQFKIQLGLPTNTCLELDRSPLEPLRTKLDALDEAYATYRKVLDTLDQQTNKAASVNEVRRLINRIMEESDVARSTRSGEDLRQRWTRWRQRAQRDGLGAQEAADLAAQAVSGGTFLPIASTAAMRNAAFVGAVGATEDRTVALRARVANFTRDDKPVPPELEAELAEAIREQEVAEMELALQVLEARPWEGEESADERRKILEQVFRVVRNKFALVIENARIERLETIFAKWPDLPPILVQGKDLLKETTEDAQAFAEEVALANRLDLMNVRATLVDVWRQIALDANGLLGIVNLNYHLDVLSTLPQKASKPLDFEGRRSLHELTIETQLPLVRLNERNLYRAGLIAYQRQRRSLMLEEDRVRFDVRQDLRQLRQFQANYDLQKLAVELAYQQVDNTLETLQAPPEPGLQRDAAAAAAALTQQIINAQRSLPQAQNTLFNAWVSYVTTRMRLYRDLELLRVDARGVWIDEFTTPDPPLQRPADPRHE